MSTVPDDLVDGRDLVALHRGLQRVDGVDLGHDHPCALAGEALGAALADVAVAQHEGGLAADHHVGGAVDAVDQRVPAAVEVVELALGDRVVHVDGREQQLAALHHLVEPVDARGGLLRHAPDRRRHARPLRRVVAQAALQQPEHDRELGARRRRGVGYLTQLLELGALVHQQRRVAAVVEDHVGAVVATRDGPRHHLLGAPPVLLERLALPGEHRDALRVLGGAVGPDGHGRGRVVLGREDVARRPAHLGAELDQCLDEHRGLDGHVQRAGDAGTGERLQGAELLAEGAQAGHLVLGEVDLATPEGGQREVGHAEVVARPGSGFTDGHGARV